MLPSTTLIFTLTTLLTFLTSPILAAPGGTLAGFKCFNDGQRVCSTDNFRCHVLTCDSGRWKQHENCCHHQKGVFGGEGETCFEAKCTPLKVLATNQIPIARLYW